MTRSRFWRRIKGEFGPNWEGSLTFEKVERYFLHFNGAIQASIYVVGISQGTNSVRQVECLLDSVPTCGTCGTEGTQVSLDFE